jgi:hypothetical protein
MIVALLLEPKQLLERTSLATDRGRKRRQATGLNAPTIGFCRDN